MRADISLHRLEAVQCCRNLMGRYSLYNSQVRRRELIGLFSRREDVLLEMPWGIYDGQQGLKNRYLIEQGDRGDPAGYGRFVGKTVSHEMDTEIIEVAADGETATGCWLSPGCDTGLSDGEGRAMWCWTKFAADFILEDGEWKIWHLRLYHMYRSSYTQKWTDCDFEDYAAILPRSKADRGPTDPTVWEIGQPYPTDQPLPPLPYESFGQREHRIIDEKEEAG